jgi:MinD-like ATPase involved in chromosome partitioning or flagellar assembly
MLSKRPFTASVLIGGAFAALQSAAVLAADADGPATALEAPIAAVSDAGQLHEVLRTHNDVDESHIQADRGMQEGAKEVNNDAHEAMDDANHAQEQANDAKSDVREAQQDVNEATQEGSQHNSENNGQQPATRG